MLRELILAFVTDCIEDELPILRDQLIDQDVDFELFCGVLSELLMETEMEIQSWEIDLSGCGEPEENPHYDSWVQQLDITRRALQYLEAMQSWSF